GVAPAAHVITHGEAQLWGFIALFIVGISLRTVLQAAPRHRFGTWACRGLLSLALVGVSGSVAWLFLHEALAWLGPASAGLLFVLSVSYWVIEIAILRAKWKATWARAVMTAGFWLVVWASVTVYFRWLAGAVGPAAFSDSQRL